MDNFGCILHILLACVSELPSVLKNSVTRTSKFKYLIRLLTARGGVGCGSSSSSISSSSSSSSSNVVIIVVVDVGASDTLIRLFVTLLSPVATSACLMHRLVAVHWMWPLDIVAYIWERHAVCMACCVSPLLTFECLNQSLVCYIYNGTRAHLSVVLHKRFLSSVLVSVYVSFIVCF
jgi:hypothetical protein